MCYGMIIVIIRQFNSYIQGFGVAARSTQECRRADPTTIIAFHQADIGQYVRSENTLV